MNKKNSSISLFTGALQTGKSTMKVISKEIEEIETKIIKYGHVSESLEVTSMDHISLPFFTRKRSRRVNLQYQFSDMGVTMYANLTNQNENIKQPSELEESIYEYVMQRCFDTYRSELYKNDIDDTLSEKEKQLINENIFSNIVIEFNLDELLEFLGAGASGAWRSKIDQAMENMKFVEYYFDVNNRKLANNSTFQFETRTFKLLNYEKIKVGRKKVYRVWPSSTMLSHSFQNKNYLYFTPESRKEIGKKSRSALRVFRYISKKRFAKEEDTASLEALAMIVPYEIETIREKVTKQGVKQYVEDRRKKAKKLIEGHMEILVELGYLSDYQTSYLPEQNSYEFWYRFGEKMGIVTSYLIRNKNKKERQIATEKNKKSEVFYKDSELTNKLVKQIRDTKKNIYISKAWNKRVDNKINKIVKENGEEYAIYVLKLAYKNLKKEIRITLVQYFNGIMKNVSLDDFREETEPKKQVKPLDKPKIKVEEIIEAEVVEGSVKSFSKLSDYSEEEIDIAVQMATIKEKLKPNFLTDIRKKSEIMFYGTIKKYLEI